MGSTWGHSASTLIRASTYPRFSSGKINLYKPPRGEPVLRIDQGGALKAVGAIAFRQARQMGFSCILPWVMPDAELMH